MLYISIGVQGSTFFGSIRFNSQIKIHTGTEKKDVSLTREFKNHMEGEHRKNGVINQGKSRKDL